MSPSFTACDLCFAALGPQTTEVQISRAQMVQLTEQGRVAHRPTGLRNLRVCSTCGDYLVAGFQRLLEANGRAGLSRPSREQRAG